ncbi:MAG: hypothetical protein KF689_12510 [Gemmatimonadaceae bacterium]|nr:hypothetical protein [Gemmatimonadaceae bacterium]MCW5827196.1 hypothetical protein [Gemmatimonadaceae bacterium]
MTSDVTKPRVGRLSLAALGILLACGEPARTDAPPPVPLGAASDSLAAPRTLIRWLAETQNGVVVIHDQRDGGLMRTRAGSNDLVPVTTPGAGPLEVRRVQRILRGPGDSLWVMDIVGVKAVVLDADGRPKREERSPIPSSATASLNFGWVRAVSEAGDWYASDRTMRFAPTFYVDDSASVVRWRRADGRTDTLARVGMRPIEFTARSIPPRLDAFDPIDAWGVFRDGRVIVVRARDYGIELVEPDGRVIHAGRGPTALIALTRADAEYTRDSLNRERAELMQQMPGNPLGAQAGVAAGSRPLPALPDPLPSHWPLLRGDEISVDWQDRAWVRVRSAPRDTGASRYDLFDRDGRFLTAVAVAAGGRVIGFGRQAVFVAWSDDDGLQWVKRHPMPPP